MIVYVRRLCAKAILIRFWDVRGEIAEPLHQSGRVRILAQLRGKLCDYTVDHDFRLHHPARDRFVHDRDVLVNVSRNRSESRDDILVIVQCVRRHVVNQNVNAIVEAEQLPDTQEMYLQVPSVEVRLEVVSNQLGAAAVLA